MNWILLICCLTANFLIIRYVINNEDNIEKSNRAMRINIHKIKREKREKQHQEFLEQFEDEKKR